MTAPLVLMLSAAHPPEDVRIVAKEGAALAEAGLRVLHLAPAGAPPPRNGAGTASPDTAPPHGVALATYPRRRGWAGRVFGIPALARRAAALRPAVLHAHEPDSWLAALLAARRCGARVVLDVHEHYPSRLDARLPGLLRPLARAALRRLCLALAARADAVVVAKDGLDDAFGGPQRCTKVRNYATPVAIAPRRHGPGPLTLVHLGALARSRGAMVMLDALSRLPTDTRLRLVGRITDGSEGDFAAAMLALGLSAQVETLDWMPREAALARAAEADIGLVLFQPAIENHRLALPHKLFDCMLVGLPVIVPAIAEEVSAVVRQAGCGLAVDTADPGAVAEAVRVLADPALRADMGAAGRRAALEVFGWAPEAERLVGLYRRLTASPSAASQSATAAAPASLVPSARAPR